MYNYVTASGGTTGAVQGEGLIEKNGRLKLADFVGDIQAWRNKSYEFNWVRCVLTIFRVSPLSSVEESLHFKNIALLTLYNLVRDCNDHCKVIKGNVYVHNYELQII